MTRDELLSAWQAMSDRERDAAVARDVMGWKGETVWIDDDCGRDPYLFLPETPPEVVLANDRGQDCIVYSYTKGHAAAYVVEERIAEMGLIEQYATFLTQLLRGHEPGWVTFAGVDTWSELFRVLHASPAQRCCAAWVTCKMREGEK